MKQVGDSGASVPAFLAKLWKLVEDPTTDDLINWNENGVSFTIRDQARFARELLPLYYKHNNMASFVRQLNMYGFHKVVSVDSGGLKLDKDEMEFAHPYFLRGHEYLLDHIKRKIPLSKQEETKSKPEIMSRILTEVRVMKGLQETVDTRLAAMKRENEALWREVASLRQKHMKQQQIVNKLIQFLISIVQPNGRAGLGMKRRYPLMLGEIAHSSPSKEKDGQKGETRRITSASRIQKGTKADIDIPTISMLSPTGPIIHDVTDIIDEVGGLGGLVEVPVDHDEEETLTPAPSGSAQISEVTASDTPDFSELPIYDDSEKEDLVAKSLEEALVDEQPDFNTIVQMESGVPSSSGSNLLESEGSTMVPSPLSPDLLMAVDPRELNASNALLSVEDAGRKNKESRGKAVSKKSDMQLVVGEPMPMESREEFDQHLDTIQVDLDNLREVLSLQGSPLDAATLLGVCDSLGWNLDPNVGGDPFSWSSNSAPRSRAGKMSPLDSSPAYPLASLLDQQKIIQTKLFNMDEPVSMPMSSYMSSELDAYRDTPDEAVAGNELIAYNSSLFELADDDGQHLLGEELSLPTGTKGRSASSTANLLDEDAGKASASLDIAEKDVDLLELLSEPSASKKKKAN